MINVAGVAEELATSPKTFADIYLLLRDYIGRQMTITHANISRSLGLSTGIIPFQGGEDVNTL